MRLVFSCTAYCAHSDSNREFGIFMPNSMLIAFRGASVHLIYTLTGRQGHPHKTVRIECGLSFIDTRSTK